MVSEKNTAASNQQQDQEDIRTIKRIIKDLLCGIDRKMTSNKTFYVSHNEIISGYGSISRCLLISRHSPEKNKERNRKNIKKKEWRRKRIIIIIIWNTFDFSFVARFYLSMLL
jgi:hypothetical protein